MPWSITFLNAAAASPVDGLSMGSVEEVREKLGNALPDIAWQDESGLGGILGAFAGAESDPFLDRLRGMAQESAGGNRTKALYSGSGVTIEF